MTQQSRREELLGLFAQTRIVIDDFTTSRSQAEQAERGTAEKWSAKDLLAAVGFWMDYTVDRLGYFVLGEKPPQEVDFGAVEAQAVAEHQPLSWSEMVMSVKQSLDELVVAVQQFPDETFSAHNSYGDGPGGEVCGEMQANGFIWPLQEFEKYYQRVGEQAHAEALRKQIEAVTGKPVFIVCDLIAPQDLHAQQQQQATIAAPLIIDVRDTKEFAQGHVAGAINIPLQQLQSDPQEYQALLENRPVVTYCNMHHPGQSRGEQAAAWLHEQGYQAMALRGGFPAWREAGLPVDTAPNE